jgi:5-methylcytosine-specific restriction enzyme A
MAKRVTSLRAPWQAPKQQQFDRKVKNPLYHTRRWRNLRALMLKENPLCVLCEAKGVISVAKVVDHMVRYQPGDDFFNKDNLQGLCAKCHNRKSGNEGVWVQKNKP